MMGRNWTCGHVRLALYAETVTRQRCGGRASKQLSLIGTQSTLRGEIGGENILCQRYSHLGDLVILILGPT